MDEYEIIMMRHLRQFAYLALALGVVPGDAAWRQTGFEGWDGGFLENQENWIQRWYSFSMEVENSWTFRLMETNKIFQKFVVLRKKRRAGMFATSILPQGSTFAVAKKHRNVRAEGSWFRVRVATIKHRFYMYFLHLFKTPSPSESPRFNGRCGGAPMREVHDFHWNTLLLHLKVVVYSTGCWMFGGRLASIVPGSPRWIVFKVSAAFRNGNFLERRNDVYVLDMMSCTLQKWTKWMFLTWNLLLKWSGKVWCQNGCKSHHSDGLLLNFFTGSSLTTAVTSLD